MQPYTFVDMLRAIRCRWRSIVLLVASGTAVAAILSRTLPPKYEGTASLFPPASLEIFALGEPVEIRTRGPQVPVSAEDQLRGFFGILRSRALAELVASKIPQRDIKDLRRNTRFTLTKYNLFQISALDEDPQMAAHIANTFAESFNELFEQISLQAARRTRIFIEGQLKRTKKDLVVAEERVRRFQEAQQTISLSEETTELVKRLALLRGQISAGLVNLGEIREKIIQTEGRLRDEARTQMTSEVIQNNPAVEQLETKLVGLEVELAGALARYTPIHPEVQRLRKSIEELKVHLQNEVRRIVGNQTTSLNPVHQALRQSLITYYVEERAVQRKVEELRVTLRNTEEELQRTPKVSVQLAQLLRDVRHLEEAARVLALKLEEAKIQERREVQTFVVVDHAKPSPDPVFPNLSLNVILAVSLSAFVGLCFAVFVGYFEAQRPQKPLNFHPPGSTNPA